MALTNGYVQSFKKFLVLIVVTSVTTLFWIHYLVYDSMQPLKISRSETAPLHSDSEPQTPSPQINNNPDHHLEQVNNQLNDIIEKLQMAFTKQTSPGSIDLNAFTTVPQTTAPPPTTAQPPKINGKTDKNIFLIDANFPENGELNLTPKQACAVESAARNNPDWNVYLISLNTWTYDLSKSNVSAFLNYKNIRIFNTTLLEMTKGSIMEHFILSDKLTKGENRSAHAADFLRLLLLYLYGGLYLDTDFIVLRSFNDLTPNFGVAETGYYVATGAMMFQTEGAGHYLVQNVLVEFVDNYDPDHYSTNGPILLTKFAQQLCGTNQTSLMTRDRCHTFEVLPTKLFYPIGYESKEPLLNPNKTEETLELVKDSYAVHEWNGIYRYKKLPHKVGTKAAIGELAKAHCPYVYYSCGEIF